ncbi:MAG: HAMP domain-containing histidine kinase [Actinomycetota bacterium]|nr:HAMP domain-containing histidine kinase [Actinomycetota bacterium]
MPIEARDPMRAERRLVFRSLRVRMAVSHAAVIAVILLVLGGIGQALLARSLDRSATASVLAAAREEVARVVESGSPKNPPDSDVPSRSAIRMELFLPSGRPLDTDERLLPWLRPHPQTVTDVVASGEPVRIITLPARAPGGGLIATVVAGRSLAPERGLIRRVRLLLLFGGAVAVAASMAAGWWLAGRAARPVRRAYEAQANFAADASHELRTPLTFVRSAVEELAERDPELGTEILSEIDYLTALTERLLLLARTDSRTLRLAPEPIELEDVCKEAARRGRGAHGLDLELVPGNGVRALADRVATEAALDAVLENVAVHGGGKATVRWDDRGQEAVITVQDHGSGLPAGHTASAFERFFRADPARTRDGGGGAGLGLPIARALVEAQSGRIWLEESPGGGLTARIALPAARHES